jgi:hypothetical protein
MPSNTDVQRFTNFVVLIKLTVCPHKDGIFTGRERCEGEAAAHEAVADDRKWVTTKAL